jgi:hypothetical protein
MLSVGGIIDSGLFAVFAGALWGDVERHVGSDLVFRFFSLQLPGDGRCCVHGQTFANLVGGAIYHVMSRGNSREGIFDDERDDTRLRDGLAQTVTRYGGELLTFVIMPNHVHLFLRTPQPNIRRTGLG